MVRRWLVVALWVAVAPCLCGDAVAQQNLRSRLQSITAPIRRAGVYHVATGTWTRNASLSNVTGPDTIYNNTCMPVYLATQITGEKWQHRSRLPSTSGPTTPSVFYGTTEYDEAPGCHDGYTINGFEVSYCSSATSSVGFIEEFANSYAECGLADMVPDYSFTLTALPGGTSSGAQQCWLLDIDLSATTPSFILSADGDGTYVGPSTLEQFGWSIGPVGILNATDFTGPIVAGDFTCTVGHGPMTPCTGTDGTIWDNPINLFEGGTGMASNEFFRITAPDPLHPTAPGCFDFGGNPHADFWLKLFADPQCPTSWPVFTVYCFPGEGGIKACTTCSPANRPLVHGRGCDNFGAHTGGAILSATGSSSVAHDTIVFTSSFENPTALTVLMQGTTTTNMVFGAGIRCVAGILKRLYIASAAGGTFTHPAGADPSVHVRSAALGYVVNPPVTLYYLAYYRDPQAASHCAGATFNASESGYLNWVP